MPNPDVTVGDAEIATLKTQAASGNADAQALLKELGHDTTPDNDGAGAGDGSQSADGSGSGTGASGTSAGDGSQVEGDKGQGGRRNDDSADGKESVFDTIRQLRRDRRTLREENARLKEQVEQVLAKMNDFMSKGGAGKSTEAKTDPSEFFADPDKVLRSREDKLVQTILAQVKNYLGNSLDRKSEGSEAVRILKSMPGYDPKRDEHELLDLMEEHGLDVLAKQQPMKAALLAKKLWQERNKLSDEAKQRKEGAASGGSGGAGGSPRGGSKKPTLEELNKQAKEAHERGDFKAMDEIMAKIGELVA